MTQKKNMRKYNSLNSRRCTADPNICTRAADNTIDTAATNATDAADNIYDTTATDLADTAH